MSSELRHRADAHEKTGAVGVLDADVVELDVAVPGSICDAWTAAVKPLENVSEVGTMIGSL